MFRDKIISAIKKVTEVEDIKLDVPEREEFGDYATNVALNLKSQISNLKTTTHKLKLEESDTPRVIAEKILEELKKDKELLEVVEKIDIGGPGFINFWLKKDVLVTDLIQIDSEKENFGKSEIKKGKKISIEFTDPNPFKEFHIGHLYSNTIGESLARLQEGCSANVWRADYFGDAGIHVAKAIWGLRKKLQEDNLSFDELSQKDLRERINFMAKGYAIGSKSYDEDENVKKEIERLNTVIYLAAQKMWKEDKGREPVVNYDPEKSFPEEEINEIYNLYKKGRSWSLDYFEEIYKRLGTKFDGYYPESVVAEIGYKYVQDNIGKVFEKSEGAVIYKGEKVGLHTRVFINKHNLPTYEAKELGLAPKKYEDFPYDESIIVTGNEIDEYFKVLISALKEINPQLGNATLHIGHGMVRLAEGKMSSRTGNVITAEEIIDEVKGAVSKILEKTEVEETEKDALAEKITIGAVKYSFLKNGIGQDLIFDLEKSLSLEGNSGPYLQYTFARTQSVLRKFKTQNSKLKATAKKLKTDNLEDLSYGFDISDLTFELNNEEAKLLRSFVHFQEVIEVAAKNYSPNILCNYLYDLAQKFNAFYNAHRILDAQSKRVKEQESESKKPVPDHRSQITDFRLSLTSATGQIIKNGLHLLGIQAPERM